MKQVLIVAKIFAFLNLLFVPSIVLVVGFGLLIGETTNGFFGFVGIAVFAINLAYVGTGERRARLARKLAAIAGVSARSSL